MIENKINSNKPVIVFSGSFPSKWYEKISSNTIKKLTNSKWSHVSVFYKENDVMNCFEATTPKIQKNDGKWLHTPNHEWEAFEINWNLEDFTKVVYDIEDTYIGKPYGYLQLIGAFFSMILRLKKNIFKNNLVCSELTYLILAHASSPYKKTFQSLSIDQNLVSPQDLYIVIKIMESLGFSKLIEKCNEKEYSLNLN